MTNEIDMALNALNGKIDVVAAEMSLADIGADGLFSRNEVGAMITGIMGGKGALPNNTDLNSVKHGGAYYLPVDQTCTNHPFESNANLVDLFPAQLEVITNYGSDPRTTNPLVCQKFITINHPETQFAYRFYYGGNWTKWHYPFGKTIWRGSISTSDGFKLTDPITNFVRIEIFWNPYALSTRSVSFTSPQTYFQLHAINMPDAQSLPNPSISAEEVDIRVWGDSKTCTASHSAFYIQNGVTKADDIIAADITRIVAVKGYTEL